MAAAGITAVVMPKWGLEMRQGTVTAWLVEEGSTISVGQPIVDIETDKISNTYEAGDAGLLRRRVAQEGETLPVKALLAVLAPPEVADADIDAFIAGYVVPAAAEGEDEAGEAFVFSTVDGIRVRHARRGPEEGVPVLFIHGFGGDLGNWLFNLDAVAEHHPVIALDLPGHGQSDARLPGTTLAALSQFVGKFLDSLGVDRVHAVGHSMGGAIAATLAQAAPQRVASITLVNSAGLGPEINVGYTRGFVQSQSRRDLKPVLEQLFADPALVNRQLIDDVLKYKRLDGVEALLGELGDALFGAEGQGQQAGQPARDLNTQRHAVLVVTGAADQVIPAAHAKGAPAGAKVKVMEGAGHMTMMEKASEFNTLLKAHLQGHVAEG